MGFTIEKISTFTMQHHSFLCDKKIHAARPTLFMDILWSMGTGMTFMPVKPLSIKQAYRKAFHQVHVIIPSHAISQCGEFEAKHFQKPRYDLR
jgi:hypothetical protein